MTRAIKLPDEYPMNKRQDMALEHLSNYARDAHYDGDGILVNHICSIALNDITKPIRRNEFDIPITKIHWSPILSLYWLIDDYMLHIVREVISKLQPTNDTEKELHNILKKVFYLVEQSLILSVDEESAELENCNLSWLSEKTFCEDSTLLTFAVELVWFRDPEGKNWTRLLNAWSRKTTGSMLQTFQKLKDRLEVQTKALYPSFKARADKDAWKEWDSSLQRLHQAWNNFLDCEWDSLDKVLEGLAGSIAFESPLALPLFHLHHFTRYQRLSPESQPIGLTRRRLQLSTRKAALSNEFRDMTFNRKMVSLLLEERSFQGAPDRFHCFRLAMLNQISALRIWELASFMEGVTQEYTAHRELFRFKDENYYGNAWALAHRAAFSAKFKIDDPVLVDAVQTLDWVPEEERERLIESLLSMRRVMGPSVIACLSLLSDAIPEKCLPSVADWCIAYFEKLLSPSVGDVTKVLSFWIYLIRYAGISSEICQIIYPLVIAATENPLSWDDANKVIEAYLIKSPINLAIDVGNKMFSREEVDENWNSRRWGILYNAIQERPELGNQFKEALRTTAKNDLNILYLRHLLLEDDSSAAADDEDFRSSCRNMMISFAQGILDRQNPVGQFGSQLNAGIVGLVTWPKAENELISTLQNAITAPYVQDHEIPILLSCLAELILKGPVSQTNLVQTSFQDWLLEPPRGKELGLGMKGPLSIMQMNMPGFEEISKSLIHLAIAMCIQDKAANAQYVGKWSIDTVSSVPIQATASMFYLVSLLGIASECLSAVNVVSLVQSMFNRSAQSAQDRTNNYNPLASLLRQIAVLCDPGSNNLANFAKTAFPARKSLIFEILASWIPRFSEYNSADVRAGVAQILRCWTYHASMPDEFDGIIRRLQKDARARVRSWLVDL